MNADGTIIAIGTEKNSDKDAIWTGKVFEYDGGMAWRQIGDDIEHNIIASGSVIHYR